MTDYWINFSTIKLVLLRLQNSACFVLFTVSSQFGSNLSVMDDVSVGLIFAANVL